MPTPRPFSPLRSDPAIRRRGRRTGSSSTVPPGKVEVLQGGEENVVNLCPQNFAWIPVKSPPMPLFFQGGEEHSERQTGGIKSGNPRSWVMLIEAHTLRSFRMVETVSSRPRFKSENFFRAGYQRASIKKRVDEFHVLGHQTHAKDVVLVELHPAIFIPRCPSSELIGITAFVKSRSFFLKSITSNFFLCGNFDCLYANGVGVARDLGR